MAIAPDGSVWVAELADSEVRVWTWDGDRWEMRGTFPLRGYLDGRISFAFLPDGRVRLDPLAALIDDGPYQFELPASPTNQKPEQGSYAVAPDGSIWVVTLDMGVEEEGCSDYCLGEVDGLYVITPEAVAAAE